jgi:hypothetical protein
MSQRKAILANRTQRRKGDRQLEIRRWEDKGIGISEKLEKGPWHMQKN